MVETGDYHMEVSCRFRSSWVEKGVLWVIRCPLTLFSILCSTKCLTRKRQILYDMLSGQVEIFGCVQPSLLYAEVLHRNKNGLVHDPFNITI